jgi:hypothetical protein
MKTINLAVCGLVMLLQGCSLLVDLSGLQGREVQEQGDAGQVPDAEVDAGADVGQDAGAEVDAESDAGADADVDAEPDVGQDAGTESGQDAGQDGPMAIPLECPYHCPNKECYDLYQRLCAEAGLPTQ